MMADTAMESTTDSMTDIETDADMVAGMQAQEAGQTAIAVEPDSPAADETLLGLDSYAWVGLAFACFLAILWKAGAFRLIGNALDSQAERVRADLAEAASLKAEAEQLRTAAATEAAQAAADAKATIEAAEVEAKRIIEQAGIDADAMIRRRTRMAQDRIAAETHAAEAELRERAADLTVKAAAALLSERAQAGGLDDMTNAAIAAVGHN